MSEPSHLGRTPLIGRPRNPDGTWTKDPRRWSNQPVEDPAGAGGGSGPARPARARQVVRRTPKDLSRARAMLTDALVGLQEGRYTTYKAEALAHGARTLIRLAERRMAARAASEPPPPPPGTLYVAIHGDLKNPHVTVNTKTADVVYVNGVRAK